MSIYAGILLSLLAGASGPSATAQDGLARGWTLVREDLELFLAPEEGTLRMEGTLVARLDREAASSGLDLVMNSRSRRLRFEEVRAEGASVSLNGQHPYWEPGLITRLRFAAPKKRGDEVEVTFACVGDGTSAQFAIHESSVIASWTMAWYPVLFQEKGSLGALTRAPGRTVFHLPPDWHAVTNGKLVSSSVDDSGRIEVWESEQALSRSFAAGPYSVMRETAGELEVSFYLLSDDLPDPGDHAKSLALAIAAMEEGWGPYPYPSYAIVEVPRDVGSFGASSEQGFIMVKSQVLEVPGQKLPLFAHEASHGWWGNTVGTDFFCSEALAQYGGVIAAERVWGREEAIEYLRFSRAGFGALHCARGYFEIVASGRDKPLTELVSGGDVDDDLVDAKGHWIFHMLRRRVGDEAFFEITRGLIDDYAGRAMTVADVRAAFVAAAPDAGLKRFFEQWMDRTGAPVLAHDWHETEEGVSVSIVQLQEGKPFELWLDVGIESTDGATHTERIVLGDAEQTFELAVAGAVLDVSLDPRNELLIWAPDLGPAPDPVLEHLSPDPLPERQVELYAGDFDLPESGGTATISAEAGRLTLSQNGGTPQPLVHTGGHRFRAPSAFVEIEIEGERAHTLLVVEDNGSFHRAMRR